MTTKLLDLITPADGDYDVARLAWNRSADQRPALIVEALSADHVVDAVHLARSAGLRIAPQGLDTVAQSVELLRQRLG